MIVHFVVDEKIIDQTIDNFLEISSENVFLVFTHEKNKKYIHITREGSFIRRFDYRYEDINEVLNEIKAKAIIIHQLNLNFAKAINQIEKTIKIAWVVWGFDIYSLPKISYNLFAPKTKKFIISQKPIRLLAWKLKKHAYMTNFFYNYVVRKAKPKEIELRAIQRIHFFCTYIKEDFDYFKKYYSFNHLEFIETAFSSINQYLAGNNKLRILKDANNILIGNSNTLQSNYLDAIKLVAEEKKNINKVFVVLSYGPDKLHKRKVIESGEKLLGTTFFPLLDFLPRNQYIEILQSCSTGIFYHYRQQAMGNIIAMLYMGARVYLSEKNPAYHYFLRKGVFVNSIENDFKKFQTKRLESEKSDINRKQLDLIFSHEKVLNDLKLLSQTLQKT
ncbi:MAG: TDP-N-acetylfucosamine:lipid II N-acetylfucosaminyltransferase [Proteiniphilum sp.]